MKGTRTGSLSAGEPANVDVALPAGVRRVSAVVRNTGANPIAATVAHGPHSGTVFGEAANLGTLAAGASALVPAYAEPAFLHLRFTLTSAAGSSYTIEFRTVP